MNTPVITPRVLVDEALSEHIQSLVFDTEAFYTFAKKAGFSDAEISGYTVHFTSKSRNGLAGSYNPRKRTAEIYLKDILASGPASTGHLHPREKRYRVDTQYSKVISRVVAHETGHHSRAGRMRGGLTTAGTTSLLAAPLATAGVGMLYTSVSGSLIAPLAAFMAETTAVATLSYRQASHYNRPAEPEKLFTYHRSRFSEKNAFAAEAHTPVKPLVKIRLK
jgi:hypothetical protein